MGSYTPRLNLYKPDPEETAWASDVNNNFDILDEIEFHLEDSASAYQESGTASAGVSNNAARSDHVHPGGAVSWDKISGRPSTFPPSTHASAHAINGSDQITPASIGAEPSFTKNTAFNKNYETDVTQLKSPGSANLGSKDTLARADHVHPAQTSISGNAATASKFQTTRSINVGTAVTGTAQGFDGSKNITIPITAINANYITSGVVNNDRLTVGSKTSKGILQVGDGLEVVNGVVSCPIDFSTVPIKFKIVDVDQGYGVLYNGLSHNALPLGYEPINPDETKTVSIKYQFKGDGTTWDGNVSVTPYAINLRTGVSRSIGKTQSGHYYYDQPLTTYSWTCTVKRNEYVSLSGGCSGRVVEVSRSCDHVGYVGVIE